MKWIAAAGILACAIVATATYVLIRDRDGADTEAAWWEELLAAVPADRSGNAIVVTNAEALGPKFGLTVASDDCPWPFGTAYQSTAYFYGGLWFWAGSEPPGLGFDDCEVRKHLGLYNRREDGINIFAPSVEPSEIRAALEARGFAPSTGDTEVLSTSRELGGFLHAFQHVQLSGRFVITSSSADLLPASANGDSAPSLTDVAEGRILRALGDFDAGWILEEGDLPIQPPDEIMLLRGGLNATREQKDAIMASLLEPMRAAGWGRLPVADRVAVAYLRTADGHDVMKIALVYAESETDAAEEFELRLNTYESLQIHVPLCDSANAETMVTASETIVIGECEGGRAASWNSVFQSYDTLFLHETIP